MLDKTLAIGAKGDIFMTNTGLKCSNNNKSYKHYKKIA